MTPGCFSDPIKQRSAVLALFFYGMALFIVGGDFFVIKIILETTDVTRLIKNLTNSVFGL
jgi:hypothetical protein